MTKNVVKTSLLIVAICFIFGCSEEDSTPVYSIVGEWAYDVAPKYDITYTFNTDGTWTWSRMQLDAEKNSYLRVQGGTYRLKGADTLFLRTEYDNGPEEYDLPLEGYAFYSLGEDYIGEYFKILNKPDNGAFVIFHRKVK